MPFNFEPAKFEQVSACFLVPKDPGVLARRVQFAPIAALFPVPGLVWVFSLGVPDLALPPPVIQPVEGVCGYCGAEVVRPSSDNRIEPLEDALNIR